MVAKVIGSVTFAAAIIAAPQAAIPLGLAAMAWSNLAALVDARDELRAGMKKKHVYGKLFLRVISSTASAIGLIDIGLPLDTVGDVSDLSGAGAAITDFFAERGIWESLAGVCYDAIEMVTSERAVGFSEAEDMVVLEVDKDLSPDLKKALQETLEADYLGLQKVAGNSDFPDRKKMQWLEDMKKWRESHYAEMHTIDCDFIIMQHEGHGRKNRLQRSTAIKGLVGEADCRRAPIFGRENGNPFCITAPPCPNGR